MSKTRPWRGRKPMQECPICGAAQPLSARTCSICGAVLPGERTPVVPVTPVEPAARPSAAPPLGEDDLYAGDLTARMWRLLLVAGVALGIAVGVGIGVMIGRANDNSPENGDVYTQAQPVPPTVTPATQGTPTPPTATPLPSPTRPMALLLPTVTPAPPTATPTPTPGPCYQTAGEGDTVLAMAMRCGHRDMAVIDLILEINGMKSPQELQLGQTLEIPWPTPTPGAPDDTSMQVPAPTEPLENVTGTGGGAPPPTEGMVYNEFGTPDALAYYRNLEPTLRPGLAWHTVQAGETIMGIAYMYDTSVETLSQLNPEVAFLQCDYGERYGGPNCSVILIEGQRIRVPVPIPTVTPTFTPNGTFTPTPTATATYNAPYLLAPEEGAHFMADQIVTLRWGSTGTLGMDARYVVRVTDLERGEQYMALTSALSYTLPEGWQPTDGRTHTFEWTVSVATVDAQDLIVEEIFVTAPRRFLWDGR